MMKTRRFAGGKTVRCVCPDGRGGQMDEFRGAVMDDGAAFVYRHGPGTDCFRYGVEQDIPWLVSRWEREADGDVEAATAWVRRVIDEHAS